MPKLHAAEQAFVAAIARGTRRSVTAVTEEIVADAYLERGRFVALDLRKKLGALARLPPIAGLAQLDNLDVSSNQLTSIDLRGCGGLDSLDVRNNRLGKLDLSPLVVANEVRLSGNPLREVRASEVLVHALASVRRLGTRLRLRKNTPAELHQFASAYNWDDADAYKDLGWVARNPVCDRATALLIYWRAQPEYSYGLARPDPDEQRKLAFLHAIERRFADGFYRNATIAYDPGSSMEGGKGFRDPKVPAAMRVRARPKR